MPLSVPVPVERIPTDEELELATLMPAETQTRKPSLDEYDECGEENNYGDRIHYQKIRIWL